VVVMEKGLQAEPWQASDENGNRSIIKSIEASKGGENERRNNRWQEKAVEHKISRTRRRFCLGQCRRVVAANCGACGW
jgi:hypothetical protein